MSALPLEIAQQIKHAYRLMVERAHYRPLGPLDEFDNLTTASPDVDLDSEAGDYAADWWREEDASVFHVGRCNAPTRAAAIFAVEAARATCRANDELAVRLLHLAIESLFEVYKRKRPFDGL